MTGEPKDIYLFVFRTNNEELCPKDADNPEAEWVRLEDVASRLTYDEDRDFFRKHM